jgi:flagellar basal body-associated protein FliL
MQYDHNKSHHAASASETQQKKRLPVYILIIVGVFLAALIFYMTADGKPKASEAPPGHPNPAAQPASINSSSTATATDSATATDR